MSKRRQFAKENASKPAFAHQDEAKIRRCLMCREQFLSEWAGHRVCNRCKQSAAWKQTYGRP